MAITPLLAPAAPVTPARVVRVPFLNETSRTVFVGPYSDIATRRPLPPSQPSGVTAMAYGVMRDEVAPTPRGPSAWLGVLLIKPTTVDTDHTAPGSTTVPVKRQLVKHAHVTGATPFPPAHA